MLRGIRLLSALTVMAGMALPALAQAPPPPAPVPLGHHLHHALWELREAHKELKEDTMWNFGEHKEKALHAIHEAEKQIEVLLMNRPANDQGTPTKRDLKEEYKQYPHHPHLHHALHELRHAHRQLKESTFDYGGHKEAALRDIHHAISQIEILLKDARKIEGK